MPQGGSVSQEDRDFEELLASVLGTGVKTEVLIRIMGLRPCMDTVVGDKYLRGVSGGERKRVTSAELLVGPRVGYHSVFQENLLLNHIRV